MKVTQVYQLLNTVTNEVLGDSVIVNEDLSNVVDIGEAFFNSAAVEAYAKSLVNHIGKVIFVNRPYSGSVPSVLMDGWEFGSVCEKISAALPMASENESWELENGTSYDPNIFYKPTVIAKFFNKRVTFEIDMSFTERQIKQSFSSAEQLNGFMSMLYTAVDKSLTIKMDALVMRTINNMIAETIYADYKGSTVANASHVRTVNLLKEYNDKFGTSLTAAKAVTDPEFIRYASYVMGVYTDRLGKISNLFNVEGYDRFTPKDMLHFVLLSDFAKAANVYLQSETFHDEFTRLPNAETVPYWQGSGESYAFGDISKIKVKTASNNTVEQSGILGVMFDRDALGVTNLDRRVTTQYNAKAEFFNNFYKFDAGYFNDMSENFVVFLVA